MGVSLSKGGNVSLSKEAPGMTKAVVGLGWDANSFTGSEFDLDAQAIMVGANGKVPNDGFFVFFNQLKSPEGSVEHTGDNRTGEGDGDDEAINVNLATVRPRSTRSSSPSRSTTPTPASSPSARSATRTSAS